MLENTKKSYNSIPLKSGPKLAIALLTLLILWFVSGAIFGGSEKTDIIKNEPVSLTKVRIQSLKAVSKQKIISLYGITAPSRRVDLKAEVEGKVTEIIAKEGSYVKKGDVILDIEVRDRQARLEQAKARVKQREIAYASAKKLAIKGLQSDTAVALSNAELESAKAQMILAQIDLENTMIKAPFDGWLEEINVEIGTLVGPNIRTGQGSFNDGSTIVTVIEKNPLLIVGHVSERVISDITLGTIGSAELITGQKLEGKVIFVGKLSDPVTRTFKVELEINNPDGDIISGITTSVDIPVKSEMAHLIPPSALALNEKGELGIKLLKEKEVIDDQIKGTVEFNKIEIFENDNDGVWVTNLPDSIYLITIGHPFVRHGDEVMARLEETLHSTSR